MTTPPRSPTLAEQAEVLSAAVRALNTNVLASNDAIIASNQAIERSNDRIAELGSYGRRNRHVIWGIGASVVFDIMLSILLAFSVNLARDASDTANSLSRQNTVNAVVACENTNSVRRSSVILWTHLLDELPQHSPNDPGNRELLALVKSTFQTRKC